MIREANARTLANATGATAEEAEEMLRGIEGGSEALVRSIDPPEEAIQERLERHGEAWAEALDLASPDEPPRREIDIRSKDERWFLWVNRHGFGFRLGLVEMQVYLYERS